MYAYYNLKQRERDCSVLHSAYQFETVCQDWILSGGSIWMAFNGENPVGMAFNTPTPHDSISIREIIYDNAATKHKLIQFLLNHHQLPKAELRTPPTLSNSVQYGMARIINKERMIELYKSFHNPIQLPDLKKTNSFSLTQTLLKYEQRQAFMNLMLD